MQPSCYAAAAVGCAESLGGSGREWALARLEHGALHLVVAPRAVVEARAADGVHLVEEDQARLLRARHLRRAPVHKSVNNSVHMSVHMSVHKSLHADKTSGTLKALPPRYGSRQWYGSRHWYWSRQPGSPATQPT